MKSLNVKEDVHSRFRREAKERGLSSTMYLEYLLNFHDLRHVDHFIRQLRSKHSSYDITPAMQAQLYILRECLYTVVPD